MKKKYKVVALPTKDKESGVVLDTPNGRYANELCHLYLVSDDEIELGDYVYCKPEVLDDFIDKVETYEDLSIARGEQYVCKSKKVIATTDEQLCLPIIPERFLKEYCEKGGIEDVMCEENDWSVEISPVKQSWTREEVERLCRKAFSYGWDKCLNDDIIPCYKDYEDEWINNNL